ncbi:MAG: iron-containing alcohol dehydrogenase, partial [Anaerolineae bacterium]
MLDFTFYNPARVIFGRTALDALGDMLGKYGASRVLLHYGGGSIKRSGIYEKIVRILEERGIAYVELGGVQPNPRISLVREGIGLCREAGVDFVLAVGGGSVIDSAKGIAAGVKYPGDIWECYINYRRITDALPIGVVLTVVGAGSETSPGTVITDEATGFKRYTGGECLIPKFAILNPEFTNSVPAYQTACGAADILAHLLERYFTPERNVDLTDRLLEGAMKTVLYQAPIAVKSPTDYHARAELMWAGTLAHNNLLGTGRLGDWASHDIGHELSAFYDLPHGATLSIIFPAWMRYVHRANLDRFVQLAVRVFGVDLAFED